MENIKAAINGGKTALGIEFGSTRIKAVLVDDTNKPIAQGDHEWENRLLSGVWTYTLDDIWNGIQDCYAKLKADVKNQYGITLTTVGAIGISAMMHGYMAFDSEKNLLAPFRTWRNAMTADAAAELSKLFDFNIPQRWSIAHLYQAILNGEEHVPSVKYQTTLAGYVHWMLTGSFVLGVGEASGMFPIDSKTRDYNKGMLEKFYALDKVKAAGIVAEDILPKVLVAGENAGTLTDEGAKLLDPTGDLTGGIPMCPPEGDA
ncbi:MAG: ATPase, partial [Clostridia bacterium]|nr:ATPase [Clostridia bacterium]